jgi:hypothetical protein
MLEVLVNAKKKSGRAGLSTAEAALWLMGIMRARVLLPGALALFTGCTLGQSLEMNSCTTKTDCASNESCEQGLCMPMTSSPARREDGGSHYSRPDGTGYPDATDLLDSGQPDIGAPDGGIADTGDESDAGFNPGCPNPISVDGFAGYCTIGAAIAAANTGSLVEVPAGNYAEAIDISKALTLRGLGVVNILGSAGITPLRLRANGITVESLTIQAAQTVGVEIVGSSTLNLITINGAAGIGIAISLSGTIVTINGAVINGVAPADPIWGEGIEINSGTSATVLNSIINDAAYLGILNLGGTLTVGNTQILRAGRARCDQDKEYCGYGLVTDNGSTTLQDNTVIDQSSSAGVLVYQASLTMTNSTITNSGQREMVWSPGILIDEGDPVHVNNSIISNNQDEGIGCWDEIFDDVDSCANNTHTGNAIWTTCDGC